MEGEVAMGRGSAGRSEGALGKWVINGEEIKGGGGRKGNGRKEREGRKRGEERM